MVWKNLIQTELGISFLDGCELVFDEHMQRRQAGPQDQNRKKSKAIANNNDDDGDMMDIDNPRPEGKTWKERFQHLLAMRGDLAPVQFRVRLHSFHHLHLLQVLQQSLTPSLLYSLQSMRSIRLPALVDASEPQRSPCGGGDCGGMCGAAPSTLGCKHYRRDCKLLAACCGRFFVCRHCHDEQVHDHRIDRYATQLVVRLLLHYHDSQPDRPFELTLFLFLVQLCMACNAIQPAGQHCTSPQCQNRSLGRYTTPIILFRSAAQVK